MSNEVYGVDIPLYKEVSPELLRVSRVLTLESLLNIPTFSTPLPLRQVQPKLRTQCIASSSSHLQSWLLRPLSVAAVAAAGAVAEATVEAIMEAIVEATMEATM